jgi:hypothetical protein
MHSLRLNKTVQERVSDQVGSLCLKTAFGPHDFLSLFLKSSAKLEKQGNTYGQKTVHRDNPEI